MSNFVSGQQSPDEEGEAETLDWSLSGISHLSGGQSGIQGRHFLPSEVSNLSGRSSNLVSPDLSAMIENDSGNYNVLFLTINVVLGQIFRKPCPNHKKPQNVPNPDIHKSQNPISRSICENAKMNCHLI